MMHRKYLFLCAVLVGTALLGAPTQADAAFTLTITDGTNTVNITDNGSGDLSSNSGRIVFDGTVGLFDIQTSIGTSNAPGTATLAQLTINNLSISSAGFTGTQTLTITLQDTGFTSPTGKAGLESQVSTTQLPANTTVTYQSFLDSFTGTQLSLNTVGGTRINEDVTISSTPYTLKSVTSYTITGQGANTTLTVQTTGLTAVAVPGPAGLALALVGIPVAGFGYWRRRQKLS